MSYNNRLRRGGGGYSPMQQNLAGIGQRRGNFGNQSTPQRQGNLRPPRNQPNQDTPNKFNNQQNEVPKQSPVVVKEDVKSPPAPEIKKTPVEEQPPKSQEITPVQESPKIENNVPTENNEDSNNTSKNHEFISAKEFWASRRIHKVSKAEQQRRRNIKLGKLLQPKSAAMIFNELVKNPQFTVNDAPLLEDQNQYRATVYLDEVEHIGLGRSKTQAKNNAAETAIRYLIRKRKLTPTTPTKTETEGEKMEVDETNDEESSIPWQHVASLALFKLFNSWGEDPKDETKEPRRAKKMPENPETMQPLMLLYQMLPNAQFAEVSRTGGPTNLLFTYKCTVDGEEFIGKGTRAKLAKRMAAYAACHKLLNVNYPPEVWSPSM